MDMAAVAVRQPSLCHTLAYLQTFLRVEPPQPHNTAKPRAFGGPPKAMGSWAIFSARARARSLRRPTRGGRSFLHSKKVRRQSVCYFTVPPRAHPSAVSPSGFAAPGQTQVPSTRSRVLSPPQF